MSERRFGQVGRLRAEKREEYIQLHANVWPEIRELLKDGGIENYSIFIRGNLVFAYFEYTGTDYEADTKKMEENEMNQKWCALTKSCFENLDENSFEGFFEAMESIFYLK